MGPESIDDLEPMDDFERELRAAMLRQPAPSSLKRVVIEQCWRQRSEQRRRMVWIERLAASIVLAGVASGAVLWRNIDEQRRGEQAKQQVFTALRITNRALEQMRVQLEERDAR